MARDTKSIMINEYGGLKKIDVCFLNKSFKTTRVKQYHDERWKMETSLLFANKGRNFGLRAKVIVTSFSRDSNFNLPKKIIS